jgi:hypothetical protein
MTGLLIKTNYLYMKNHKLIGLLFFFAAIVTNVQGQSDTTFIDSTGHKVPRNIAGFYKVVEKNPVDSNRSIIRGYELTGRLRYETPILYVKNETTGKMMDLMDGVVKVWYTDGTLKKEAEYQKNSLNGMYTSYWENGKLKRKEKFVKGKSLGGECYNNKGEKVDFSALFKMPIYPEGGEQALLEYIHRNLRYPDVDQKAKFKGM